MPTLELANELESANVTEDHRLTMFSDVLVRVELDDEGNAAIFFAATEGGNIFREVSFDADAWARVTQFWDSVVRSDD